MKQFDLQWVITMDGLLNRPNKAQAQGPEQLFEVAANIFFCLKVNQMTTKRCKMGAKSQKKTTKKCKTAKKGPQKETPNMQINDQRGTQNDKDTK